MGIQRDEYRDSCERDSTRCRRRHLLSDRTDEGCDHSSSPPRDGEVRFLEFESGALLEETDKFAEIGTVVDALRKDVNVIRHEAKRVETERVRDGGIENELEDVLSVICVGKMRRAAVTADGDKIGLSAKVVFGG